MTTRLLPREEWPRLNGTEAETVWPWLNEAAKVVVVEDEQGQIVGCHLLQPILHGECLWIHPAYRKRSSVGRRLWGAVQSVVREQFGVGWFATGCASQEVNDLLAHVGAVKLPDHYMVPVAVRR